MGQCEQCEQCENQYCSGSSLALALAGSWSLCQSLSTTQTEGGGVSRSLSHLYLYLSEKLYYYEQHIKYLEYKIFNVMSGKYFNVTKYFGVRKYLRSIVCVRTPETGGWGEAAHLGGGQTSHLRLTF